MGLLQVSIVLGSYNRLPFLKLTIESIRREMENSAHEIIVVDGGSTDGSMEWLIQQKDVLTIIQNNRGGGVPFNVARGDIS
jgi:glycosyltransferase involved in cell wall biosynthesis